MMFDYPTHSGARTAWDMFHEDDFFTRITTSCADMDNMLGGGINCKELTEIGQSSSQRAHTTHKSKREKLNLLKFMNPYLRMERP